jgi:hypothetical protein
MNKKEFNQILEESFRTETDLQLPVGFAQKVTLQILRREQWKTDLREYLYLIGVLLSLLAVVLGYYYFVDREFVLKAFAFLTSNLISVILIVFILNFVFFVDKVLLRLLFRSLPHPLQRRGERQKA